ncbi:hypothetical protein HNQ59_003035 [Chitinivorax tropicus]|uniref:DUF1353 domain-containing protein n=1 Tax=Chitinivorax tropicus TaxID=714531 RepID=A0A840MRJ6_9PROT|nr:DUF1353 domain-containing protein [Chitinivorax tropicus]MBB5019727.1 hypothetical protein [Chitinivorax tropicus]
MLSAQPQLSPWPEAEHYKLLTDYQIDTSAGPVTIPRHFHYDGASVPALAWQITYDPFHPDVMAPALVHDWLYYTHHIGTQVISREQADDILDDLFRRNGVGSTKRRIMTMAVKAAGGAVWANDPEDKSVLREIYAALIAEGLSDAQILQRYGLNQAMTH